MYNYLLLTRWHLFLFTILLLPFSSFSQSDYTKDTLFAKALHKKGEQQISSEHFADALQTFTELFAYQEEKFPDFNRTFPSFLDHNLSRFYIGLCYLRTSKPKLALEMLTTSLQQMRENPSYKHDTLWVGSSQTMLAYIAECHAELGTYDISIQGYLEAEQMAKTLLPFSREPALSLIYANLAETYRKANNRKSAIALGYKALALDEKTTNFQYLAIDYMDLGGDYLAMKALDSAKYYLDKALLILKSNDFPQVRATSLHRYGQLLYLLGEKQTAIDTLLSAAKWAKITGNKSLESQIATNIALLYFQAGNFSQALQYAENGLSLSLETPLDKSGALHIKAKTLQALGQHKEAMETLQLAAQTDSVVYNMQRLNYADGMAIQLKVREHEEQLQAATQKLKTQQQKMLALVVGILAILLISIALYFAYRWQKKAYLAESEKLEMEKRAHKAEAIRVVMLESKILRQELALEGKAQNPFQHEEESEERESIMTNFPLSNGIVLDLASIVYIKSDGNHVDIHTTDGKKYVERMTLKKLNERLPKNFFEQPHRSYIINVNFVKDKNTDYILMEGGLRISRSKKIQP